MNEDNRKPQQGKDRGAVVVTGGAGFIGSHTCKALAEKGVRDQVKIMIGGGTVTDEVREYSGADAYGEDAVVAVNLSKNWVGNI